MKRNLLIFDRVSRHMVYEPEVQLLGICLKKFMLHKKNHCNVIAAIVIISPK